MIPLNSNPSEGMLATIDELTRLLSERPAGLITDLDGTISRIAPAPELAVAEPAAREALRELAGRLDLVAVISGRSAADAQRLLQLDQVVYVGNHGLERRTRGRTAIAPEARPYLPRISQTLTALAPRLPAVGVMIEDKGATASIHYRQAPDPELAKSAILAALRPLAEQYGLRISHGRRVVELRLPVALDKGSALRELVRDYQLRSIVFLGDDVTDLDAMRALQELRASGAVSGLSVGVVGPETPDRITHEADLTVTGVDDVAALLTALSERLRS
ncbi:trehalose-phosphatase [Nitrolancea hollandica]|uniref:Trehalose 6-phosphate phosphatase n=1 Tax=Nitrolancea hollandica Lb TaxID=1129897 RepID=I4EIY5_9BACT|nr:trehalose-phosphatase [Nitrolancea hollandica]CCF84647.1 Trehalose-phosphatase [Nitrolancea hollandica Lb]